MATPPNLPPHGPTRPTADVRTAGPRRRPAFTLIELILVLVVLAILVGIAVPAIENMSAGQGGKDTAAQLLALTYHARSQAIAEGVNYRLVLDVPNRAYYLAKQVGFEYVPLGEEVGRPHLLPDGVDVAYDDAAAQEQDAIAQSNGVVPPARPASDLPCVEFYPSGRIDPAVLVVTSQRDKSVRRLVCPSPTETFRIVDSDGEVHY